MYDITEHDVKKRVQHSTNNKGATSACCGITAAAGLYMTRVAGGANPPRPSQVTPPLAPLSSADRSQSRNADPFLDGRPTSPPHLTPTPSASSSDVYELKQMVAGLQSHNSQLMHITKQQQMTIAQLEVCNCWAFTDAAVAL